MNITGWKMNRTKKKMFLRKFIRRKQIEERVYVHYVNESHSNVSLVLFSLSFHFFLIDHFVIGLSSAPKLLKSNVDVSENHSSKKELWTIMKFINGERLYDYIKSNKIDFREALHITRQLLKTIKEIHSKNVIHRDIQPKSILIQRRPNDQQMNFMFINFGSAFINNYQWKDSLEDIDDYLGNQFYQMPQFEQRAVETKQFEQSPIIDTTGICAILFWILTGHEPKESKDIWQQSPHYLRDHPKMIKTRIDQLTG
jgi:serine/threonine protein kinase